MQMYQLKREAELWKGRVERRVRLKMCPPNIKRISIISNVFVCVFACGEVNKLLKTAYAFCKLTFYN